MFGKSKDEIAREKAEEKRIAAINRKRAAFVKQIKTDCAELDGLRTVTLRLEFIESHPTTPLRNKEFDHAATVEIYKEAIANYKSEL